MEGVRLPRTVLAKVFIRSFFLQASWNFERMQSLGLLFVLYPALRLLYRGDALTQACSRHLEYFNTHPFFASPVIGTILALEEQKGSGDEGAVSVQEFKRMVMAPYAAVGDALFWGGIRPLAAGISLFFAAKGSMWAPLIFLAVFNVPHLWLRTAGLVRGYTLGLKVVETMQRRKLPDLAIRLKETTVVLLGGLSAYLIFLGLDAEGLPAGWGLLAIPMVVLFSRLTRRGVSSLLLVLALALLLLLFAWLY